MSNPIHCAYRWSRVGGDFEYAEDYGTPQEAAWDAFRSMATESVNSLCKRQLLIARIPPGEDEPDMVWAWQPVSKIWQAQWPDPQVHGLYWVANGLPEVNR